MSYRDELDAAQAKIDELQRQLDEEKAKGDARAKPPRGQPRAKDDAHDAMTKAFLGQGEMPHVPRASKAYPMLPHEPALDERERAIYRAAHLKGLATVLGLQLANVGVSVALYMRALGTPGTNVDVGALSLVFPPALAFAAFICAFFAWRGVAGLSAPGIWYFREHALDQTGRVDASSYVRRDAGYYRRLFAIAWGTTLASLVVHGIALALVEATRQPV